MKIRNISKRSILHIIELKKKWYDEWDYAPPIGFYEEYEDVVLGLARSGCGCIKIAYIGDKAIGYAIGSSKVYSKDGLCLDVVFDVGYLFEVYVRKEFRKKGIAKALLRSLETHFRRSGKKSIFAITYLWNKETQRLLEGAGWKLSGYAFSKDI